MSKIWTLFFIFCLSTLPQSNIKAATDELFDLSEKKIAVINESDVVEEVLDGYLLTNNNYIKYIYDNKEVISISEEYFAHTVDNEYLYLISKNKEGIFLNKINKKSKKQEKVLLEIANPIDITINENELIIVGTDHSDAIISKYDKNLNYLQNYYFGGSGYEAFEKIYCDGEDYYLIGTKDAHSVNSPFLNVGNSGEQKTFVVKINKQGIILETCYFNHQSKIEEFYDSDFNDLIMIKLKINNEYHVYYLDNNLQTVKYEKLDFSVKNYSVISNTKKLLTVTESNILTLVADEIYELNQGILKKVIMDDNVLKVYYYQDNYLWEMIIYQYKIIKKEPIIINRINAEFNENMDMNSLEEIEIESFIHQIDLKLDSIDPYFSKQIHGMYSADFKIVINSEKSFQLANNIIVEEYINIYNEHTYPVGYNLHFSGYALLDNKSIVSGFKVTEAGIHNLIVTDNIGNKSKYNFWIVDSDYYKKDDNSLEFLKAEYIINKNEELMVEIKTNNRVKEIYVDGESMNFETNEQGVFFKLTMFDKPGMYQFTIDKIVYDTKSYEPNKTYLVRVLKDAPIIDIREEDSKNLKIVLDIKDLDKSLENIRFVVYEKNKDEENIVEVIAFDFLKTNVLIGNIQKDKEYGLKGYLVYDVGLGELVTEEFFDTSFIINMDEYLIMETGEIDDFTEIGVEFNTNNPALNIIKLKVGNTDLKDKYQVINDYTPIYISVGLSMIVLGIGVGYYFYRKRKNSR